MAIFYDGNFDVFSQPVILFYCSFKNANYLD